MVRHVIHTCIYCLLLGGFASAEIVLRSGLSQIHQVSAGEVVRSSLLIENVGESQAAVRIYQTDYTFQADGSNHYPEPGSVPRSNAPWLSLEQSLLQLPPGETVEFDYSIAVPATGLSGTYWSMIMVEEITVPQAAGPDESLAVRTVVRYGVQVVTELAAGDASLAFREPAVTGNASDGYSMQVTAANDGTRMIRASYYLELYDEAGTRLARIPGTPKRTYPGTSVRQSFLLGAVEPGSYTAVVVADGGGDLLFGAQYQLNLK